MRSSFTRRQPRSLFVGPIDAFVHRIVEGSLSHPTLLGNGKICQSLLNEDHQLRW
jgi:hypothetical protein